MAQSAHQAVLAQSKPEGRNITVMSNIKNKVLILGGGFGGLYAALAFEKHLKTRGDIEVTVVNRDNFFLFTPMLHEVAASDLDLTNIVIPGRKFLKRVQYFTGDVINIDCSRKRVTVSHGFDSHSHEMPYDHLVLALGSVTNFSNFQVWKKEL